MLKTFTFAMMHFSIALGLAYLITGDLMVSGMLALLEPLVNTFGYVIHEKIWQRVEQNHAVVALSV